MKHPTKLVQCLLRIEALEDKVEKLETDSETTRDASILLLQSVEALEKTVDELELQYHNEGCKCKHCTNGKLTS